MAETPEDPPQIPQPIQPESPDLPEPETAEEEEYPNGLCPVVGIGASAGGLEAFTQFLKNLPENTGMAFVMVQHLDPHHESVLAELLATHTTMPVEQASHGMEVAPNHVYVIPPKSLMTIRQGVLQIAPREPEGVRTMPIDDFLRSLADDQKSRAIGVILSGSASDGTMGLKAIKEAGGITFAQDHTAKFDSMPRNAVAAGVVDFILPPAAIARELAVIAHHAYLGAAASLAAVEDGPGLRSILSLLREIKAVDFNHYKKPTVKRRLAKRMALRHTHNAEGYLALLQQDPSEVNALFDDLLINVTEFFRDPGTFELLSTTVFPVILKDHKPDNPIRIWVPGCSTGEEVYSIGICLSEYLEQINGNFPVQLFGTDISDRAIAAARTGKYGDAITAVVSPERLKRFFIKQEQGGYQIARSIRDCCIFSRHDLTRDVPLSKMDLISCRNLLIYLGSILQRRAIATFSYALQPAGCLILGHSESLGSLADHFIPLDREHKIFKRNLSVQQPRLEFEPGRIHSSIAPPPPQLKGEDATAALDREADRLLAEDYAPGSLLVDAKHEVVKFRGNVAAYLATPSGDASLDLFRLVREDLAATVQTAFSEAATRNATVRKEHVRIRRNDNPEQDGKDEINVVVRPLTKPGTERHFLVLFEEQLQQDGRELGQKRTASSFGAPERDLAEELATTRTYLQSLIEELRTANEEAQSSNEELQSTNEELQTAKEELQSTNEELTTTNDEMKSRNNELSQVNNDLLNLLGSLQVPIVMLSKELRIRRFTPLAEKTLNLIPTDVGRPISDLKPRINVPDLEQLLAKVVYSLTALEQEVQDREGHWYSMRINPYRVGDNQVEGAVLQLLDIDQLKRTVEAAEHARNYSETIFGTVREPLVVLDGEFRVQTANQSFFETFGGSSQEIVNRGFFELHDRRWDSPKIHELLDGLVAADDSNVLPPQDIEIEQDIKGAGRRTFQLNARFLKKGRCEGQILLALADVTDRKKAAEAKYRRLFETAKDGILVIDADSGEITDANAFIEQLFGFSRAELAGKRFWETELMSEVPDCQAILDRLRHEEMLRLPDAPLRAEDGRRIEVEAIANMYWEGEKRVVQFNFRDITERKLFDRQLQQTAKLESLGLLAGGVAHDFNNLLTGIMGNASLILDNTPASSPDREHLRELVKAAQSAADLTRQMLAYSGQGRFVVELLDFSELVREIGSLMRSSIPKTIDIELDLAADLAPVHADATQIRQLVMNLVINAAEAIGEGKPGSVRIASRQERFDREFVRLNFPGGEIEPGTFVALEIADSGSGMDEATKARIFDPFFTTKFTGRGLGLSAALGIVKGHRGAIRVHSTPGQGTVFKVYFPALPSARIPKREETKTQDLRGTGLVLLVDDEDTVLHPAAAALRRYGYEVMIAPNGETAVDQVRLHAQELSLVLLDLTMPVMGGEEAWAQIKDIRPDLPVILSSGYDEGQAMKRFGDRNVAGFIQKPYSVRKLLELVKSALR
jgi:two-component system CheB/CheR fusion protein